MEMIESLMELSFLRKNIVEPNFSYNKYSGLQSFLYTLLWNVTFLIENSVEHINFQENYCETYRKS